MSTPRRVIGTGVRHPYRRSKKTGSSYVRPANKARKIYNH